MRQIARQSSRLTSCQRLRQSSRPQSPCVQQRRTFHPSSTQLSESRPPNGASSDQSRSQNEQHERGTRAESGFARTEHPDSQENGEGRRVGLRKTLRQRRAADIPKPPPLPEWFLKHNITLRADVVSDKVHGKRKVLRCVDSTTEHTLFHVPYHVELDSEVASEGEKEHTPTGGSDLKGENVGSGQDGIVAGGMKKLDAGFFQHVLPAEIQVVQVGSDGSTEKPGELILPTAQIPPTAEPSPLGFRPSKPESEELGAHPLTWALLEIEASARAAMSLAREQHSPSSFAASRTDLSLFCPDPMARKAMDSLVQDLAIILDADVVSVDANDLADITDEYVGQGSDTPGSFSTLGYDVFNDFTANDLRTDKQGLWRGADAENAENEEFDEDEAEEEDETPKSDFDLGSFGNLDDLRKALQDKRHDMSKALSKIGIAGISFGLPAGVMAPKSSQSASQKSANTSDYITWDDVRLNASLDSLLDGPSSKRSSEAGTTDQIASTNPSDPQWSPEQWRPQVASLVVDQISQGASDGQLAKFEPAHDDIKDASDSTTRASRTIVHVRDLKEISQSKLGEAMVKRLAKVVQKRRRAGQEIIIVGTSAQFPDVPLESLTEAEDHPFRTIVVPPFFGMRDRERRVFDSSSLPSPVLPVGDQANNRILEINERHICSMLRRLQPSSPLAADTRLSMQQFMLSGTQILGEKVLSIDQVQRLVLTAMGLSQTHAKSETVQAVHIALATAFLANSDHATRSWSAIRERTEMKKNWVSPSAKGGKESSEPTPGQARLEALKKNCSQHETRLFTGVVDPQNIRTGFADVHAPPETIEALKTLTTLSLLRPDAFKYGVLAADRLPGLMLYGPPGTGKTLLAKAVAKESKATVLEVSGAQIYEKYVGEGEKMVRAVFSLAKKLSPCIVFIDEADAIFGSRGGGMGNRTSHREIINQFLREWDGMDDHGVFIMVASNRPFDLDDAVMRRLPRRLLVDLPVAKDRQGILGIHLRNETVADSVSLEKLAEQTPLYSGSDLKNLCVAAALAAVREENEMLTAAQLEGKEKEFKFPDKRTLTQGHFDKALQEISASISEDMGSLTAIRKFDEQFGDRKGRRKKAGYGFGLGGESNVDESAARVRQAP